MVSVNISEGRKAMQATRVIVLLVTISAAMLLFSGVVSASPEVRDVDELMAIILAAPDPEAALAEMTPAEQALVIETASNVTVEETVSSDSAV